MWRFLHLSLELGINILRPSDLETPISTEMTDSSATTSCDLLRFYLCFWSQVWGKTGKAWDHNLMVSDPRELV